MESVETTGPTLDEAIESALDELGLERDEVDIEVLDQGVDDQPARVKVTPRARVDDPVLPGAAYLEEDEDEEFEEELEEEPEPARSVVVTGPSEETMAVAAMARDVLDEVLAAMDMPCEAIIREASETDGLPNIELEVVGEYLGILIGHHGDTLAALQFLTGLMVSRRLSRRVRIIIDIEGYRERRARMLREMAMRAAERAQRYRQPIFLDPMPPAERREVHLTLQSHPYVTTHSIGEGDNRRVVVSPRQPQRLGGTRR